MSNEIEAVGAELDGAAALAAGVRAMAAEQAEQTAAMQTEVAGWAESDAKGAEAMLVAAEQNEATQAAAVAAVDAASASHEDAVTETVTWGANCSGVEEQLKILGAREQVLRQPLRPLRRRNPTLV